MEGEMSKRSTGSRWPWFGGALAVAAGAGAAIVSIAVGASPSPSPSPSPIPQGCQLQSPQPEAPLKLNVVAMKRLVKTVAMEKETFNCYDTQSTLSQLKDVETFIEVVSKAEGGKSPGLKVVEMTVEAYTCLKDIKTGRVSCKAEGVPLAATDTPLTRCSPTKSTYPFAVIQQPSHPVEMSTVAASNDLAATVKVEKEVLDCSGQIGDLYLFTEIVERRGAKSFDVVQRRFSGLMCLKNEVTAQVTQCKLFTPGKL
jgi:hypothetical protein